MLSYVEDKIRTINPYNFVPLKTMKTSFKNFNGDEECNLSGYIEVSISPKNEFIIPGQYNYKTECYDYYHYENDKKLVIPGPTIRGTIRNVYACLTNSCLSDVNSAEDQKLSKRISINEKWESAIMFYDKNDNSWYLSKLEINFSNKRDINKEADTYPVLQGDKIKFLDFVGNPFGNKKSMYRFPYRESKDIKLSKESEENLKRNLDEYIENCRANKKNNNLTIDCYNYEKYKIHLANKEPMVVFYADINKNILISPSQIGRMSLYPFIKSDEDLYKKYIHCNEIDGCCPTCKLFGFVDGDSSITSRVSFTDFVCDYDDFKSHNVKMVLGEPHPSNTDFYCSGNNWLTGTLRGRKFYYHHKIEKYTNSSAENMENSYTAINPNNVLFRGKVYFSELSKKELSFLVYSLCFRNNKKYAQKIGHAKPLGYGSMWFNVDSVFVKEHSIDNILRPFNFVDKKDEFINSKYVSDETCKELMIILDCEKYYNRKVRYPEATGNVVKKGEEIMSWFSENKNMKYNTTPNNFSYSNTKYRQTLPKINNSNIELKGIVKESNKR